MSFKGVEGFVVQDKVRAEEIERVGRKRIRVRHHLLNLGCRKGGHVIFEFPLVVQ